MRKVDGLNGRKFLVGVLVAYFLVLFFSYFYFMAASPIIIGNAIVGLPTENGSPEIIDPALAETLYIMEVLIALVIIVYVIPRVWYKRHAKNRKIEIKKYSAFKNH
ncbi:MAG: hypothetical protein WCI72_05985 [archaeon]